VVFDWCKKAFSAPSCFFAPQICVEQIVHLSIIEQMFLIDVALVADGNSHDTRHVKIQGPLGSHWRASVVRAEIGAEIDHYGDSEPAVSAGAKIPH
jgi:hypothetical protein